MDLHWRKVAAKGEAPSARYGHTLTIAGDAAYVFGGVQEQADGSLVHFNDMYKLDVSTNPPTWSKIAQKGSSPSKREGHTVSAVGKSLYLFGGSSGESKSPLDDFFVFDIASNTWAAVKGKGTTPSKRNNHSACAVGTKIFIFGGFLDGVAGNDVHVFDTVSQTWSQPPVKGTLPAERVDHTWTLFGNNKLVLFGGAGDDIWYNDLFVYNTETGTWINPSTKGTTPPKRDYHSMVNFDEKNLVLFGGTSADAEFNDVFVFSTTTLTWSQHNAANGPSKRWSHAAGMAKGSMWIWGGTSEGKHFDELWALGSAAAAAAAAAAATASAQPAEDAAAVPKKPPRAVPSTPTAASASSPLPTTSAVPAGKLAPGLTPVSPVPASKPTYGIPTPAPAPRKVAPTVKPHVPTPRSLKSEFEKASSQLQKIFDDIESRYQELDVERAAFTAERTEFSEEVKLNLAQYDQQQKEVADMIDQHRKDNDSVLAKRQAQYDNQMAEVQRKQTELTDRENKLAAALVEFDDKKKKMETLMAQFTQIRT